MKNGKKLLFNLMPALLGFAIFLTMFFASIISKNGDSYYSGLELAFGRVYYLFGTEVSRIMFSPLITLAYILPLILTGLIVVFTFLNSLKTIKIIKIITMFVFLLSAISLLTIMNIAQIRTPELIGDGYNFSNFADTDLYRLTFGTIIALILSFIGCGLIATDLALEAFKK